MIQASTYAYIALYSLLLFLIYTPQDLNMGLIEEAINFYSTLSMRMSSPAGLLLS